MKRLGNAFTRTCLNLKHTEEKYDNIRKHHGNWRSAPCPTPHCIKMFNILFKNLQIEMKIHIWIAKWFLTIQIRTIPCYWKSWLQYLLCPRIFRTTHVCIGIYVFKHVFNVWYMLKKSVSMKQHFEQFVGKQWRLEGYFWSWTTKVCLCKQFLLDEHVGHNTVWNIFRSHIVHQTVWKNLQIVWLRSDGPSSIPQIEDELNSALIPRPDRV